MRTVYVDANGIETNRNHLLEDIKPELGHWKTESMEFARAEEQREHCDTNIRRLQSVLDQNALVVDKECVVVPLDGA